MKALIKIVFPSQQRSEMDVKGGQETDDYIKEALAIAKKTTSEEDLSLEFSRIVEDGYDAKDLESIYQIALANPNVYSQSLSLCQLSVNLLIKGRVVEAVETLLKASFDHASEMYNYPLKIIIDHYL